MIHKASNTPEVICYLCGIVDDNIKEERAITFNNSAAENKVLGICDALRSHVKHVVAVSTGRGASMRSGKQFPAVARRVANVPVLYASFWHNRLLSHMITAFSLVVLLFRLKKLARGKDVSLIAYNRKWIYFPMLCTARILGVRCFLDLEDAAIVRGVGVMRKVQAWVQRQVIDGLCNQGALLASSLLANLCSHKRKLVCHGVAYPRNEAIQKAFGDTMPVRILFGGSLMEETGAKLMFESIRLLEREHQDICGKINIVITGYGPLLPLLQNLAEKEGRSWLEFHGDVSFATYQSLLASVDIGLCLKLPSSEMSATTFPSKVVEYASFGKAVLSTRIPDVVRLFGEDGAYYVADESPESLVATIREIALNPARVGDIAKQGQKILIAKSGKDAVARDMMKLLAGES